MADNPLVDEERLKALVERATNALRPLGLTVEHSQFGVDPDHGLFLGMTLTVRDSAAGAVDEDLESKAEFNQMMAQDHARTLDSQKNEILAAMTSDDALEAALFKEEDDCPHENAHEGLCLDCGKEFDDTDA